MGPGREPKECENDELVGEFEIACRGGDYEYAPEYKEEILRRMASNQGEAARLREALERTLGALYAKNSGIPIRDLDETIAEAEKALSSHTEDTDSETKCCGDCAHFETPPRCKLAEEETEITAIACENFEPDAAEDTGIQNVRDIIIRIHREWSMERNKPYDPTYPTYDSVVIQRIAMIEEIATSLGITIPGITDGGDEA